MAMRWRIYQGRDPVKYLNCALKGWGIENRLKYLHISWK